MQGAAWAMQTRYFGAWLLLPAGVLTKIDIMDPGTNCRDVLEGQTYVLRNGWIGVVNRGQADINSRVRICAMQGCLRALHLHKPPLKCTRPALEGSAC
jgi:hypothetical protein